MFYINIQSLPLAIILYCILNYKNRDYIRNILVSIGFLPFLSLLYMAIYSTIHGTGLVGDTGGIDAGLFAIAVSLMCYWYIYITAIVLLICLFKNKKDKEKNTPGIIEKAIMIALIITNGVYLINWLYVDAVVRPLNLDQAFKTSNNIHLGIGVTAEKISENSVVYRTNYLSLIILMLTIFVISLLILINKRKRKSTKEDKGGNT